MPNSQTEHPQELIAAQIIDDPFSMEFMEQANTIQVSANSLSSLPKRRSRVVRDKFVLHKDLKTRLNKLIESNCTEQAKTVAKDILSLKYVPIEGKYCNYLGLSQADYTKISYLDKDREERLKGQETTIEMIRPGTIIKIYAQKSRRRAFRDIPENPTKGNLIYTYQLKLTSRHLNGRVYPINRVEPSTVSFIQEFWDNEPAKMFHIDFNNTYLAQESETFRISHSRVRGADRVRVDTSGFSINGNNWDGILAAEFENTTVVMKEVWNFKKRYHTSIGKIVRRLFGDKYSDREVTAFAEAYASLITVSNPLYDFEIIEGEAIKEAYYEDNYYCHSGTLGNSCMRYYNCQRYFKIYTDFPEKVKMAVLRRSGKIAARCIMWNIEGKFMFDRIYYINDEVHNLLKNTLVGAGYETLFQKREEYSLQIDLTDIDYFPYVDSLYNYDPNAKILTNRDVKGEYWQFRSTGGSYSRHNTSERVECHCCGDELYEDDATYLTAGQHEGEAACSCCYIYCEVDDSYVSTEDDFTVTYDGETVLTSRTVRLHNGQYAYEHDDNLREYENGFGYFILDEDFYYTDGNIFYHRNDPNIPEDAYDSDEANRREEEERIRLIEELRSRQAQDTFKVDESSVTSYSISNIDLNLTSTTANSYLTYIPTGIYNLQSGSIVEQLRETLQELEATAETLETTETPVPDMEISLEEVRNDSEAMEASAQGEAEFTMWSQIPDEAPREMPF